MELETQNQQSGYYFKILTNRAMRILTNSTQHVNNLYIIQKFLNFQTFNSQILLNIFCNQLFLSYFITFFFIYFYQLEANYFTVLQWFLPYIDINQPWIYMCSPSRSPLPPPSPSHPSGSSQCTSPEHVSRVSCIQPGLVICFTLDSILVSMLFSQNIPQV